MKAYAPPPVADVAKPPPTPAPPAPGTARPRRLVPLVVRRLHARFPALHGTGGRTQALRKFRRDSGLLKVLRCYAEA